MIRRIKIFLYALLLLIPGVNLSGETVFGGEGRLSASLLIYDDGSGTTNTIDGFGDFSLFFNAYSDKVDFYFEPRVNMGYTAPPALHVDQLYITYPPADFITLKAGRFFHLPGVAEFFSVANFFHRYDLESLLAGDFSTVVLPNDMFQAGLYGSSFYIAFTLAPFPGQFTLIDGDSPWFPTSLIPEHIEIETNETKTTYELNSINTVTSHYQEPELKYVSLSGETGITLSVFELWAGYYHGIDHDTIFRSSITLFEYQDNYYYDLTASPVAAVQDVFGLSGTFSLGGFRFWAEGAFTLSKTFATDRISFISRNTLLEKNPYLEITTGIGYTFENLKFRTAVEYTDGWAFSSEHTHLTMPTTSLISVLGSVSFFEDRLSWTEIFILEVDDWSFVLNSALSFLVTDTLKIGFVYPFFYGAENSPFGQYRENYPFSFSLSWKF